MSLVELLKSYPRNHGDTVLALSSYIDSQHEEML